MNLLSALILGFLLFTGAQDELEDSLLFQVIDPNDDTCLFMTQSSQGLTSNCQNYRTTSFYHNPRKADFIHIRGAFDTQGSSLCLNRALCDDDESTIQAGLCSNCGSKHWGISNPETQGTIAEEGGTYCFGENLGTNKCNGPGLGFQWLIHDVGKPGPVRVIEIHNKALVIQWTPPEADIWVARYEVQRVSNGNNDVITRVASQQTTLTLTGLNNGEDYTFQVRVIDDGRGYTLSDVVPQSTGTPSSAPGPPGIDTDCPTDETCVVTVTPPDTADGSEPSSTCYITMKDLDGNIVGNQIEVSVEDAEEAIDELVDNLPDTDVVCFSIRCENSQGVGQPSPQSCENISTHEEEMQMCDPDDEICLMCTGDDGEDADFDVSFDQTSFQRLDPVSESTVELNFEIEIQSSFSFPVVLEIISASDENLKFSFEDTNVQIGQEILFDGDDRPLIDVDNPFQGTISVTRPNGVEFDFLFLVRVSSFCISRILQREIELNFSESCPRAVFADENGEVMDATNNEWLILTANRDETQGYRLPVRVQNPQFPFVPWSQDGETLPNLVSISAYVRRGAGTSSEIDRRQMEDENGDGVRNDMVALEDENGISEFFWNLNNLEDGDYTIQIYSDCGHAALYSVNWHGVLDLNPPHLLLKNPESGVYNRGDDVGFVFDDSILCNYRTTFDFDSIPDELKRIDPFCGGNDGRIDFNMLNILPFALGETIHITASDVADVFGNGASDLFTHDVFVEDLDHETAQTTIEFDLDSNDVPDGNQDEFLDDWKDALADQLDISPDRITVTPIEQFAFEEEDIDKSIFPVQVDISPAGSVDPSTLRSGDNSVDVAKDVVLTFYPDPDPQSMNPDLHLSDTPQIKVTDVTEGEVSPPLPTDDKNDNNPSDGDSSFPWWIIVVSVVVLGIIFAGIIYARKKFIEKQRVDDPLLYQQTGAVDMQNRGSVASIGSIRTN